MYDHWLSYITIGRSVATIAEISFAYQLSCVLEEVTRGLIFEISKIKKTQIFSQEKLLIFISKKITKILFWMLVIANIFCWSSVITRNQIFHAVEETLWMLAAVLLFLSYLYVFIKCNQLTKQYSSFNFPGEIKQLSFLFIIFSPFYIIFMIYVDIPVYYNRWLLDEIAHLNNYLSFYEGIIDSFQCKVITKSFEFWRIEMPWMSGYFTLAVWFSLWLMRCPSFSSNLNKKSN